MPNKTDELNAKLNRITHAMRTLQANNRTRPLGREAYVTGARTGMSSDASRPNAWDDYGYPDVVTFDMLYNMYRRNGIARAGVMIPVNYTWQSLPTIYEGMDVAEAESRKERSAWEQAFDELADRLRLFQKLKAADQRQRVGQYSALIIQVRSTNAEEARYNTELGRVSADQLVRLIPVYEGQLTPTQWETNASSERYGLPVMYQINESAIDGQAQDRPRQGEVHHSRVIIAAEGADDGTIYGEPCNLAGFNNLIDIEKVLGASGEGLHKNASQKLVFRDTGESGQGAPDEDEEREFDEILEQFTRNMGKHLQVGEMDVTNLQSSLQDPEPFFNICLNAYSASVELPSKILIGTQTGVLAGESDNDQLLQSMQARREGWGTELVASFIDWCIKHGALKAPSGSYCMDWPDIMEPSQGDKLDLLKKALEAQQLSVFTTGEVLFTMEEFRIMAGFEGVIGGTQHDLAQDDEGVEREDDGMGSLPASGGDEHSVQQDALNGAQMNAIKDIVKDVALGQLPAEAAVQLIIISFPLVSEKQARAVVEPASGFGVRDLKDRSGSNA